MLRQIFSAEDVYKRQLNGLVEEIFVPGGTGLSALQELSGSLINGLAAQGLIRCV